MFPSQLVTNPVTIRAVKRQALAELERLARLASLVREGRMTKEEMQERL